MRYEGFIALCLVLLLSGGCTTLSTRAIKPPDSQGIAIESVIAAPPAQSRDVDLSAEPYIEPGMLTEPDIPMPTDGSAPNLVRALDGVILREQRLTSGPENSRETHVAVNPRLPSHAVAAAMGNATHLGLTTAATFDGGVTWQIGSIAPPADSTYIADPMLGIDDGGVAYAALLPVLVPQGGGVQTLGVEIYRSLDGGVVWTFMTRITSGVGIDDKVALVVDTHEASPFFGNIYVAWKVPPGPMFFSRSSDQGENWTSPSVIPAGGVAGLDLATLASGRLLLSYNQGFVNPMTSKNIQVAISDDMGDNWTVQHIALTRAAFSVQPAGVCQPPGAHVQTSLAAPTASSDSNSLWVTWTDYLETVSGSCNTACDSSNTCRSGIYLSKSVDGGDTWESPNRVPGLTATAGDQYFGWSRQEPQSGELQVAFKDTSSDPNRVQAEVILRRSADGSNWADPETISQAPSAPASLSTFQGDYMGFASGPGRTYFAWPDYRFRSVGDLFVAARVVDLIFSDALEAQ